VAEAAPYSTAAVEVLRLPEGTAERDTAAGELSLRGALRELDTAVVDLDRRLLAKVNTPAELAALTQTE
jgi:hypothetical protein